MNAAAASHSDPRAKLEDEKCAKRAHPKELSERWVAFKIPPWFRKMTLEDAGAGLVPRTVG